MTHNRFFFRCGRCLFRFAADVEGHRRPDVRGCPVCAREYIECLGATKGVLSVGVPCNDKCVFAESPDCSCSCAGKNHGSRLLIPVLRGVVDFDTGKFSTLEAARREWEAWRAKVDGAKAKCGAESQARRLLLEALSGCYHSKAWPNRHKLFGNICKGLGIAVSGAAAVMASAPLRAGALPDDSGELFAWGEKWSHISPEFRGHSFVVPDVDLGGGNIVRGVNFSPSAS